MTSTFNVLGLTPFHRPDPDLALALVRAGVPGAVDLGHDPRTARAALDALRGAGAGGLGVRVHADAPVDPGDLPDGIEFVILPAGAEPAPWAPRRTYVRVTSVEEGRAAEARGADAVIAAGAEGAGRVGEESTFVLLQRLLAELDLPVWAQGGIGPWTAAACLAGGAAGVVLDGQLALARESTAPEAVREMVAAMDGTETVLAGGHRVLSRPDLPLVAELRDADPDEVARRLGGDDPVRQLVPVGQDGAFARPLAERHRTAAGIATGVLRAAEDALRRARALRPLAPGAPLAVDHGTRHPVLQGPMTRVSDVPGFAAAVAEAGGLPFLALSLLGGEPLEELLAGTAARLGERPWGVGILGFVPAGKRAEQLEAIARVRPPFALIAGGRPSQARALEEAGITTYLHVPSAGLLDLFLKEGARRFVFEGRECGGHVGPLSSFALWQRQVDRLLAFERPDEVTAVFAGGIHDARSAAMVAALAAPLAARGTRVGILMGTAYLFTREAVQTGAIVPAYQRAAVACARTTLLETGPGHATRCVETGYARAFRAERARLEAEGKPPREVWAELERLNLGRLRIATKGIVREGPDLVDVDEEVQSREGMYMIGQLAAMRDAVVGMEDLHRDVTEGATARLDAVALPERPGARPTPDIAIVGMACVFPGAEDLDAYWSNVIRGVDSVREVPAERWSQEIYFDPDGTPGQTTPSKWGGFLRDVLFDPTRYGIPPRSIASIDPVQLLSLEVARRALEDAGYGERPFDRDRTSVVFGAEGGTDLSKTYGFRAMYPQYAGAMPEALENVLPVPNEDSFPGVLTNVISGRIANRLDLGGENHTVNAACASSHAALAIASQWLASDACDMAIVGGADVHNSIGDFLMFSAVHALSPTGRCRTFDESADGIALGEGVGAVVLKRVEDARRDGDRIYAVLKGVAGSSDGRSMGLTAPRLEGQVRALERTYRVAGISPAEVGMMEAHGTGTVVGDRTELAAMEQVYRAAGAAPGSCALGSVKSQIGHTKAAAGVASLIKAGLALQRRALPPTLHVERPNRSWDPERSPFALSRRSRPWLAPRRVAGVSAFGFGGTNYHAILEEAPAAEPPESGFADWPAELFLLRGADRAAALERAERLQRALEAEPAWPLRVLARATSCGGEGPVQAAFPARDRAEAAARLARLREGSGGDPETFLRDADAGSGSVAVLFPGQGSQYVGMLGDVLVAFPRLAGILELAPEVAARMYPPDAFTPRASAALEAALTRTDVAQVALGLADVATLRLLRALGLEADHWAGHSYGELVALHAAGAWDAEALVRLSAERARAILAAAGEDPGAMAAVNAGREALEPVVEALDDVWFANLNAPDQTILSGRTEAIGAAVERLQAEGWKATRINVACAFHSPIVAGARNAFAAALEEVGVRPLSGTVWSNAEAAPYPTDPAGARELLAGQLARPVRFADQIEAMWEAGARVFVEAGPGRVLTRLVERILGERPHVAVPLDARGEPGLVELVRGLARLAAAGVAFDPAALWAGRVDGAPELETLPEREVPPMAWAVNGQWARPVRGEIPAGGFRPVDGPVVDGRAAAAPPPGGDAREAAVLEYLRNVRRLAEAQRDVMLGYLGAEPARAPAPERPVEAAPEPEPAEPAGEPAPAAAEEAPDVTEVLLGIVSERTGYPRDMLDLDLDLEADLSIDSIKRLEILGTLNEAIGLADGDREDRDEMLEELAAIRTLRGIAAWVEERRGGGEPADEDLVRSVLEIRPLPRAEVDGETVEGRSFVVVDDGNGVARAMARRLADAGANARVVPPGAEADPGDGVIHLAALAPHDGPEDVVTLFDLARRAVSDGARWVVAATGRGGGFGREGNGRPADGKGGLAGFLKSLAREWPEGRVRAIDLDPAEDADVLAERILIEMLADDGHVEVGYAGAERRTLAAVPTNGREPGAAALELDADSVVLVTGGARGITARASIEIARRWGSTLVLVGRTPAPDGDEPAATAGIDDPRALRRALAAADPGAAPAGIEATLRRTLAEREIRSTLAAISEAGGRAEYHALDVRDPDAFGALIEGVYARLGRIDGAIHGAGATDDRRIVEKTRESFRAVFDTKVGGALALARGLRDDVRFVVFFSSLAGVYGNAGQTDYAAANDALDQIALALSRRVDGRVVSIAWGPWDSVGMVGPELRRAFERRGIGLIPVEAGVATLLDEMTRPDGPPQVLVSRTPPGRGH